MSNREVRTVRPDSTPLEDLRRKFHEFGRFHQLLPNLVRKELKVRYKNSSLGFAWSMLNPLLYLVVFYIVFTFFLPSNVSDYHVYLLSGLLAWTFFTVSLTHSTVSLVGSSDLVKKVYLPREMLALAPIGGGMIHFALQFGVLAAFLMVLRYPIQGASLLLIPAALAVEIVLLTGLALIFSSINVKAKDAQHFLDLALLAAFWMTPIVYPSATAIEQLSHYSIWGIGFDHLYLANPMTRIVMGLQRGIYGEGSTPSPLVDADISFYFSGLVYAATISLAILAAGWWLFNRLDPTFAEDL